MAWLQQYFKAMGDEMPNSNEIHLEPIAMSEIWTEYKMSKIDVGCQYLSFSAFEALWRNCFPHVKIRRYKAVTGNYIP